MYDYLLLFSKYIKNSRYLTYDIVLWNSQFYGGIDLFKNFGYYLNKKWDAPVTKLLNYEQAEKYFLALN
ncbi:MAG: hypothetical protein KBD25_00915 [Rickettsiaceae bacterium]|nr:hypothetical protein [Rickettsiaceae bacterium]